MTTIYLIRHGRSANNDRQFWGGDSLLTNEGIDEALNIADLDLKLDVLYVSEKERAKQTADYAFPEMEYIVDRRFNEINFGQLENTYYESKENLDKDEARRTYYKDIASLHRITKGDNATTRAISFILAIHEIANKYEGKKVGIISSETIILCALAYLYRDDVNYKSTLSIETGQVIELECDGDAILLKGNLLEKLKNVVL